MRHWLQRMATRVLWGRDVVHIALPASIVERLQLESRGDVDTLTVVLKPDHGLFDALRALRGQ